MDFRNKLIVSADDFGLSKTANRNILEVVKSKKIDRVSVMADGILVKEEVEEILNSGIEIDIHFDLVKKITSNSILADNSLKRSLKFIFNFFSGKAKVSLMEKDWIRQLEKFKEIFGRNPDGINSHQHIHFFPPYFKIALKLAEDSGISYIRYGSKGFLGNLTVVRLILSILCGKDNKLFGSSGLKSSDYLVSYDWICYFSGFLKKIPEGKTEIIFHPEREKEFEVIKNNL
jgi:predicted glycoside hydrolase/deacetylase ChbG (UPF0249 family)